MSLRTVVVSPLVLAALVFAHRASAFTLGSESTWGGPATDGADGVAIASDGSIYVAVTTFSFGSPSPSGPPSIALLKYAPDGSLVWEQAWEATSPDFSQDSAAEVAIGPDGSVYVAGSSGFDAVVLKFTADGTLVWQRSWGGAGADAAADLAIGPDGSIVVSGETRSFGAGEADAFVLKLDAAGQLSWQRTWGTANPESPGRVAVGPDGTVHLTSTTLRPSGLFEFDAILVRFDASGGLIDQTAVSAGEILDARGGVAVDGDGSVYVAGGIQEPARRAVDLDTALLKLAPDGSLVWAARWGGKSGDDPGDVAIGPDGTVVVAGTTDSFGSGGGGDAFALAVEPDGKGLDASVWGGTGLERAEAVALDADGSIVLGGTAQAPPYVLDRASARVSRIRDATVAAAQGVVTDPGDTLAEPAGVTFAPGGSTTFAGEFDAALVRLVP